jgi:hypothetical protein
LLTVWLNSIGLSADIVRKHWAYPLVWHTLPPILLYSGDTKNLLKYGDPCSKKSPNEEHNKDETVIVTHDLIKVKVKDGVDNGQKKMMQQVMPSTPSTPMC